MIKKIAITASMLGILAACSSTPEIQTGEDAEVIGDNLHRVDGARADMAYIDPDADFSKYTKDDLTRWRLKNSARQGPLLHIYANVLE